MKRLLIRWALPMVYEFLINAAAELTSKTENTIDDRFVNTLKDNKDNFLNALK